MIDFTHKKRPEFIQLVLIIAVACLALGAITPAASALEYDWEFSVQSPEVTYNQTITSYVSTYIYNLYGSDFTLRMNYYSFFKEAMNGYYYTGTLSDYVSTNSYTNLPNVLMNQVGYSGYTMGTLFSFDYPTGTTSSEKSDFINILMSWIDSESNLPNNAMLYTRDVGDSMQTVLFKHDEPAEGYFWYDPVYSSYPFHVDVVDSGDDYLIAVSGFDGTQLAGSAYTIAVSTYSGGYNLPLTSFPMYLGDSPVHLWTSDQIFTLPIYLSDGVTPIDYYCVLSFPADPTATGYPFWWNLTTSGSLDYPFNTTYPPVVLPTPTPLIPSDIIPHPDDLNNTVNFTGWYQEQGFEGNNITAPIYSGLRGWFSENMIPVFEFFLMPIGSLSSMITESASTSTDAISDSVNQLSSYAAPMNIVGGYVVLLVPDVVWVVVFAALSIGYVVLLIRISTGSIRDTIGRFLGRW